MSEKRGAIIDKDIRATNDLTGKTKIVVAYTLYPVKEIGFLTVKNGRMTGAIWFHVSDLKKIVSALFDAYTEMVFSTDEKGEVACTK